MKHAEFTGDEDWQRQARLVNQYTNGAETLARKVIGFYATIGEYETLPLSLGLEIERVRQMVGDLDGIEVTFSGEGCAPVDLPDGDTDTIYAESSFLRGVVSDFYLGSAEDMESLDSDDFDDLMFDEYDDPDALAKLAEISGRLRGKPEGLRLFHEILIHESFDEVNIDGASVRAKGKNLYAIIDATTLEINDFDEQAVPYDPDEIEDVIAERSAEVQELVSSVKFRFRSRKTRLRQLEQQLDLINNELGLEGFSALVNPASIFVPSGVGDMRQIIILDDEFQENGPIKVDVHRLESIEGVALSGRNIVYNDKKSAKSRSAGLCLVAEIDDSTRERLFVDTPIIWVPVPEAGSDFFAEDPPSNFQSMTFFAKKPAF